MRVVVQDTLRNTQWVGYEGLAGFTVGRAAECSLSLSTSRFVSRNHFQVERGEQGWEIQVHPRASTIDLDGNPVDPGSTSALRPVSRIRLAEFVLTLLAEEHQEDTEEQAALEDLNSLQRELHGALLRRLDLRRKESEAVEATEESLQKINAFIDELMHKEFRERVFDSRHPSSARTRATMMGTP